MKLPSTRLIDLLSHRATGTGAVSIVPGYRLNLDGAVGMMKHVAEFAARVLVTQVEIFVDVVLRV